jgi:chromosomal replication initiation ATPase DnaA
MSKETKISPYSFPGIRFNDIPNSMFKQHREKSFKDCEKEILQIVAENCGVSVDDIISETRKKEVVDARHIYFASVKLKYRVSLKSIGETVGNRDHTTVIHGIRKFKERYETEELYQKLSDSIFERLGIRCFTNNLTIIEK